MQRACRDIVDRADRVDDSESGAVSGVPVENWGRLRLVDLETRADRLRIVILPTHELTAALFARRAGIATRIWRLAALADSPPTQPTDDLLVVDVEREH